ncbi:MAG: hypothetical protein KC462_02810, partial [Cyanobacteria bacterium HKST-UBA05]|nr:hypothetical protein [Cyanobacteria bacterium HKST-UBA05]
QRKPHGIKHHGGKPGQTQSHLLDCQHVPERVLQIELLNDRHHATGQNRAKSGKTGVRAQGQHNEHPLTALLENAVPT